jgi:RNA polymerase sigma factor (sigma-70 family)
VPPAPPPARPPDVPDDPSDAELWQRVRDDDADAFGLLFERHGARIHGHALRRTADPATAEDVTAVVFLEVWRRRHDVDLHQPSALPWLYGVAGNVIGRWHRSRRRHASALERLGSLPAPSPALVEIQAAAAADAAAVVDRIRRLPRRERDVLVLSVWEGLTHAEIATALDTTVGTVKSRLSRARARLDPRTDEPAHAAAPPLSPSPSPRPAFAQESFS